MATEIGVAYVTLLPSARGFKTALQREIGGDLRAAGSKAGDDTSRAFGGRFSSGMKKVGVAAAVGFGAAFTGAAVLGKQAIDAASGLEEAQSKVNVVFGKGAPEIQKWAKNAAQSMGQSERQALEASGTFGNLLTAFGLGRKPAADMSQSMVELATDMASFNNVPIDEALEALRSGLSGEAEPLKRFGVSINDARLKEEALRLGLIKTTKDALSPAAKAQAAYSLVMKDTAKTQGDFERTSSGLANQQRIAGAEFENLKSTLGTALIPVMKNLVGVAIDIVRVIKERWPAIKETVTDIVTSIVGGFQDYVLPVLKTFRDVGQAAFGWIKDNIAPVAGFIAVLGGFLIVSQIVAAFNALKVAFIFLRGQVIKLNIAMAANPFVLTAIAVAALVAGIIYAYQHFEGFRKVVDNVGRVLREGFQEAVKVVKVVVRNVVDFVSDWFPKVARVVDNVMDRVREIIGVAVRVVKAIWRAFGDDIIKLVETTWRLVSGVVRAAWKVISGIVRGAIDVIRGVIKTVMSLIRGDWGKAWDGIKQIVRGVWTSIRGIVGGAIDAVKTIIRDGVDRVKAIWGFLSSMVTFLRDRISAPIRSIFGGMRDVVVDVVRSIVDRVKSVWGFLTDIVDFLRYRIRDPILNIVGSLRDAIGGAFGRAVDAVKKAWDVLKGVVREPINIVIGFYNDGIVKLWNAVISKIGLPLLGTIDPVKLAKGGTVPGTGDRDTVPALLTPGEFIVTKKAAKAWGPKVLRALNESSGTIDPGIFGYATGGYAKSIDEAKTWALAQSGKPYRFPNVGPGSYDCCLTPDSLVYGPDGPTPISELAAGHRVWSCVDGHMETHTVTAAWRSKDQDVFAVRTRARTVNASANHPFLRVVPKHRQTTHHEDASWEPTTGRVQRGTQAVCAVSTCDRRAFSKHLCTMHLVRLRKHGDPRITVTSRIKYEYEWVRLDQLCRGDLLVQPRTLRMDAKPDPVLPDATPVDVDVAWLIGAAVGDGSVTDSGLNLCLYDAKRDRATAILRDRWGCAANPHDAHGIVASSVRLARALTEMGMRRLGPEKRVPADVWTWSESLQRAFLDGYCDADGHRPANQKRHGERTYSSASRRLIDEVRALHVALGDAVGNVTTNHRTKPITIKGRVVRHARPLHSFAVWRGARTGESNLRQRPGLADLLDAGDVTFAPVLDVRHLGASETWDIEVEGAHNFVADGIIVHNSGLTSALVNYILGNDPPYFRRHSTGSMSGDSALRPGSGLSGLVLGVRTPYQTNSQGALVGHMAATIGGNFNAEATPPAVRVGSAAKGASSFPRQYHLPGYVGLSDADMGIAKMVASLTSLKLSGLSGPFGELFQKLINQLPGKIFDFFVKKLPGLIVGAVKDSLRGSFKITPEDLEGFADGGRLRRDGPILVGERGPELYWGSRGGMVQPLDGSGRPGGGRARTVNLNHYGQDVTPATVSAAFRMSDLAA